MGCDERLSYHGILPIYHGYHPFFELIVIV